MKKFQLLRIIFVLIFCTFSSCDLLDEATEVTFDTTTPITFVVDETAVSPSGIFYSDTRLLDVGSDPEIEKYSKKIKGFTVNKITYKISGAMPASASFMNGVIKIASNGSTIATAPGLVSLSNGAETELTTDQNGLKKLTDSLLNTKKEQIKLEGTLSQTPVSFIVVFKFYMTISASAL